MDLRRADGVASLATVHKSAVILKAIARRYSCTTDGDAARLDAPPIIKAGIASVMKTVSLR